MVPRRVFSWNLLPAGMPVKCMTHSSVQRTQNSPGDMVGTHSVWHCEDNSIFKIRSGNCVFPPPHSERRNKDLITWVRSVVSPSSPQPCHTFPHCIPKTPKGKQGNTSVTRRKLRDKRTTQGHTEPRRSEVEPGPQTPGPQRPP